MNRKQKIIADISIGVFLSSLIFSVVMYCVRKPQSRYVYYFNSFDTEKIYCEARRKQGDSSKESIDEKINYFVSDLLLGPMTNNYKYLFNPSTVLEFCFVEGKVLNVGLSEQALKLSPEYSSLKEGVQLLRFNIVKNFTNIDKVNVFLGGVSIYDDESKS